MSRHGEPPGEVLEVAPDQLKQAVEGLHHCKASLREVVEVREEFQGKPVWEGIVHVFALTGHPKATKCYAWSSPIEGSKKRRFYTVLHVPPVSSARDAVRVAIVQEHRTKQG